MPTGANISGWLAGMKAKRQKGIAAVMRGVAIVNEQIIGDAQQLTPVKTGALQASGATKPPELKGEHVTAENGFNTNYAAAVHERLNVKHNPGQAKYLETAMRRIAPKAKGFVQSQVDKAMAE